MATQIQSPKREYPIFISNRPCGQDKFDGSSQSRLAKSIAEHFKRNDSLSKEEVIPRIIGIEGGWGSGKSNVVKLLKDKCLTNYYFFEYDAWGHQEDLQRRSFLELLTEKLIQDEILKDDTTIKRKDGTTEKVSWENKKSYLLARKTEKEEKTFPLISGGIIVVAAITVFTPIFSYLANGIIPDTYSQLWKMLFTAIPFIIGFIVLICKTRGVKNKWSYLLSIYQDKVTNDITYETISEEEPTAREFKAWMKDVSDCIEQKKSPKLVVVFDNMDRLPADKVKELWSSIHTFFAEDGFENVWAIIPFDQEHLACAFGDCKDENVKKEVEKLTSYFIAKTFPIVYRVPAPVITDYKGVFNKLFLEAFGDTKDIDKDLINRIYRLQNTEPNVRCIIVFINQLVALCLQWEDQISLINIALFTLYKEDILKNSVETILSENYLSEKILKIVQNKEERQEQISALTYGVEIELARQIPLTKYIQNCINSKSDYDINKYAELNSFDSILDEVIADLDELLIDQAVQCLNGLTRMNNSISKLWNEIADRRIKQPLSKPEFEDAYKTLLLKTDSAHQQKIIFHIVDGITALSDFNGGDYYNALHELEVFLKENDINQQFVIRDREVSPQVFVDYVCEAKDNYLSYKLKTDPNELDSFFVSMMPDKLTDTVVIPILNKSQEYSFSKLRKRIEKAIDDDEVKDTNFEPIMFSYKHLSTDKPLNKKLSSTTVSNLLSLFESKQQGGLYPGGYYDTLAMSLATGVNIGNASSDTVSQVAKLMDYYASYGDLMISCVSWGIPMLNQVLKYMTLNRLGNTLSIQKVLHIYDEIKSTINVSDEELLTHLADLSMHEAEAISKENIKTVIPSATFYAITASISNELTSHINEIAIEALNAVSNKELYDQRSNYTTDYWHVTIKAFIKTDVMENLPENVSEFGKQIMQDIATGAQSLPLNEYIKAIVDKLNKEDMASTMIDIRNDFCYGRGNGINAPKFILLEPWLREKGSLNDNADAVVVKILMPIISDPTCLDLIIKAPDNYYTKLIDNARNASIEFKKIFLKNYQGSGDSNILKFAQQIDVELNPESKK